MATLSRTWRANANLALPDVSTALRSHASMWFNFKNQMCRALQGTAGASGAPVAASAWTVHSSSDGVTAGAGDNLGGSTFTAGKWLRAAAASPHSWFVLQSPATPGVTDGPYYILVSLGTASDQNAIVAIAKTAFAGGTASADPTAAGQSTYTTAATHPNSTTAGKTHFYVDDAGNFFFWSSKNGLGYAHMFICGQSLTEARPSGDTCRFVLCVSFLDSGRGAPGLTSTVPLRGFHNDGTAAATSELTLPVLNIGGGSAMASVLTQLNSVDSKLDGLPILYVVSTKTGQMGVRGRLPDSWLVGSGAANGAGDPSAAAPNAVVMGGGMWPLEVVPGL